jgi:hypothetical protein
MYNKKHKKLLEGQTLNKAETSVRYFYFDIATPTNESAVP